MIKKNPYSYYANFFHGKLLVSFARRGTVWTYNDHSQKCFSYRRDALFGIDRVYVRGVGYLWSIHIGQIKIDYLRF